MIGHIAKPPEMLSYRERKIPHTGGRSSAGEVLLTSKPEAEMP
jgi:hypothetical protein